MSSFVNRVTREQLDRFCSFINKNIPNSLNKILN